MHRVKILHFDATVYRGVPSICEGAAAPWLWSHLRKGFPSVYAALLMPDHIHIVPMVRDAASARRRFSHILGHFTRNFGCGERVWRPGEDPIPVRNRKMLARTVRYIADNPCRDHKCKDPLDWNWSSYRDVMGAIADPWITADGLAHALRWRRQGFRDRFHKYVSSDPSVDVRGTPPPRPARINAPGQVTLEDLVLAWAAATRTSPEDIAHRGLPRKLFVHLAIVLGWRDRRLLARVTRSSIRTVNRIAATPIDPDVLQAGLLCAGDARLRQIPQPPSGQSANHRNPQPFYDSARPRPTFGQKWAIQGLWKPPQR